MKLWALPLGFLILPKLAWAWSCDELPPEEAMAQAHIVFVGEAINSSPKALRNFGRAAPPWVRFRVSYALKGEVYQEMVIHDPFDKWHREPPKGEQLVFGIQHDLSFNQRIKEVVRGDISGWLNLGRTFVPPCHPSGPTDSHRSQSFLSRFAAKRSPPSRFTRLEICGLVVCLALCLIAGVRLSWRKRPHGDSS